MKKILRVTTALPFLFVTFCGFSQSKFFLYSDWYKKRIYFEIGASTGLMNCKTDIGKHGLWLNALVLHLITPFMLGTIALP